MVRVYQDSFYRLKQIIGDKNKDIPPIVPVSQSTWWLGVNPASSQSPSSSQKGSPFGAVVIFWNYSIGKTHILPLLKNVYSPLFMYVSRKVLVKEKGLQHVLFGVRYGKVRLLTLSPLRESQRTCAWITFSLMTWRGECFYFLSPSPLIVLRIPWPNELNENLKKLLSLSTRQAGLTRGKPERSLRSWRRKPRLGAGNE